MIFWNYIKFINYFTLLHHTQMDNIVPVINWQVYGGVSNLAFYRPTPSGMENAVSDKMRCRLSGREAVVPKISSIRPAIMIELYM